MLYLADTRHVYVMYSPVPALCKIGVSNNVPTRARNLELNSGMSIAVVSKSKKVEAKRAYRLEKKLHRHFSQYRKQGEWFDGVIVARAAYYLQFITRSGRTTKAQPFVATPQEEQKMVQKLHELAIRNIAKRKGRAGKYGDIKGLLLAGRVMSEPLPLRKMGRGQSQTRAVGRKGSRK